MTNEELKQRTVCMTREVALAPVRRMTYQHRFRLIHAVREGVVTLHELTAAHAISAAEWLEWCRRLDEGGAAALRVMARRYTPKQRAVALVKAYQEG